jgi:hypothetical protein
VRNLVTRIRRALAPVRKAAAAVVGLVAQAFAAGLLPESWRPWAAVVIAAGTAAGVYGVPPNEPAPPA